MDSSRIYLVGASMSGGAVMHYLGSSLDYARKSVGAIACAPSRKLTASEAAIISEANVPTRVTRCEVDSQVRVART